MNEVALTTNAADEERPRVLILCGHPRTSPAVLCAPRVRPNQAMQRTGGMRGFTMLPPDPGRRCGRPAADCFFVRPPWLQNSSKAAGCGARFGSSYRTKTSHCPTMVTASVTRRCSSTADWCAGRPAVCGTCRTSPSCTVRTGSPSRCGSGHGWRCATSALPSATTRFSCKVAGPNQALQRTGSVCGFTLLSRLQPVVGLAGR